MLREGAAGDHFIVPRTPFRMVAFASPREPNLHSRALSNLLRFALHWRKEHTVEIFNPARICYEVLFESSMFDPGGAVRPECSYQGGGVAPRRARDDKSPTVLLACIPEAERRGLWGI